MGPACKIIINGNIRALTEGLERVLMSPLVRDVMLPSKECNDYIQRMADIDIIVYQGGVIPNGGLKGIMQELEDKKVFTSEVWSIFAP